MYPFENWEKIKNGYKFGQKVSYTNFHLGLDKLIPVGTPLLAPSAGIAKFVTGPQGGSQIYFYPEGTSLVIRFLHLSKQLVSGHVEQGQTLGLSGMTGMAFNIPHCHIDIYDLSKGAFNLKQHQNFIDPLTFNWFICP